MCTTLEIKYIEERLQNETQSNVSSYTVTEVQSNGMTCTLEGNITHTYILHKITPFKEYGLFRL